MPKGNYFVAMVALYEQENFIDSDISETDNDDDYDNCSNDRNFSSLNNYCAKSRKKKKNIKISKQNVEDEKV